jgi:hypothetical protein
MAAAARVNAANGATRRASVTNAAQIAKNLITTTGPNFISGVTDFSVLAGLTSELAGILRGPDDFIAVSQIRCPAYPVPPAFQNGPALATALETTLAREYPGPRSAVHTAGLAHVRAMAPDAVRALCTLPANISPPDTFLLGGAADPGPVPGGRLGSCEHPGFVQSSKGYIPNPPVGERPGSYRFDRYGEMHIVGAVLNMVECALDTEGRVVSRGGHSLSYVRMNTRWYKADNEKGFLESKTNPDVSPYWDLKYGSIGAWYTCQMYLYFSNYRLIASIPVQVAGTRNGEYSPFQYNSTCSPDSMSAIIMLADGYKDAFEAEYRFLTGEKYVDSIDKLIRLISSPVRARAVIEDIRGIKIALKGMKDAQEPVEAAARAAAAARGAEAEAYYTSQGVPEPGRRAFFHASASSGDARAAATSPDLVAKRALGRTAMSRVMNLGTKAGASVPDSFLTEYGHVSGALHAVTSCILDPMLSAEEIASRILHPTIFLRGKRTFDVVLARGASYTKEALLRNINILHGMPDDMKPQYLLSPYLDIKYSSDHEDQILAEFYKLIAHYFKIRYSEEITTIDAYTILTTRAPPHTFKRIEAISFLILMIIRKKTWEGKPNFTHYRGHAIRDAQNAGSRKMRKNRKTRTRKN